MWLAVARRFGKESGHTYPLGVYLTKSGVDEACERHDEYRGGKYVSTSKKVSEPGWYVLAQMSFERWVESGGRGGYCTQEVGLFESRDAAESAAVMILSDMAGMECLLYDMSVVNMGFEAAMNMAPVIIKGGVEQK